MQRYQLTLPSPRSHRVNVTDNSLKSIHYRTAQVVVSNVSVDNDSVVADDPRFPGDF